MSALQLAFLNVGQGDTTIIYDLDLKEAVVVDCVNPIPVFEFLEAKEINRLRALVVTHPHDDHYVGAVKLLDSCELRGITWDACIFRWDKDVARLPELLDDGDGHSKAISDRRRKASHYQELFETRSLNNLSSGLPAIGPF